MAIVKNQSTVIVDDETKEEVKVEELSNGNFIITINGVSNELKVDIFEALAEEMKERTL